MGPNSWPYPGLSVPVQGVLVPVRFVAMLAVARTAVVAAKYHAMLTVNYNTHTHTHIHLYTYTCTHIHMCVSCSERP